jgi:DNA-binding transcriptional ArsR family regulator
VVASTLSFHLKELLNAGLLSQERDGRSLIYRASFERMNLLLGYLTENCCQGAGCAALPDPACCTTRPSEKPHETLSRSRPRR